MEQSLFKTILADHLRVGGGMERSPETPHRFIRRFANLFGLEVSRVHGFNGVALPIRLGKVSGSRPVLQDGPASREDPPIASHRSANDADAPSALRPDASLTDALPVGVVDRDHRLLRAMNHLKLVLNHVAAVKTRHDLAVDD